MKKDTLRNTVLWSALIAFIILGIWLFGKYLFAGILPFLIAWPLSRLIRPAASYISKKAKLQRNFCSVILIFLVIGFVVLVVGWLISTLIAESRGLLSSLISALEKEDNVIRRAMDYFGGLKEKFPFINGDNNSAEQIYSTLINTLGDTLTRTASFFAEFASGVIIKLPGVIFALVTAVIALFYFSMDNGSLNREIKSILGEKLTKKLSYFKRRAAAAFTSYLKSYMIIMLITFAELFLGFVILRIEYSLLLAFFIAIIDVLPVIGSGTVIIPMGLLFLVTGDIKRGVGLLVLCIIMYIVRQITEPHVLGSVMGIHPVISLFSIYLGYIIFGVGGILFLPLLTYVARAVFFDKKNPSIPCGILEDPM
ncbi:MAG: sporulation integral membrane protein YtvI [Ruminococcaceae bacterium]|nr:sporulation integral membrane protein YtvI [Oscillospiraceae bacterium]